MNGPLLMQFDPRNPRAFIEAIAAIVPDWDSTAAPENISLKARRWIVEEVKRQGGLAGEDLDLAVLARANRKAQLKGLVKDYSGALSEFFYGFLDSKMRKSGPAGDGRRPR